MRLTSLACCLFNADMRGQDDTYFYMLRYIELRALRIQKLLLSSSCIHISDQLMKVWLSRLRRNARLPVGAGEPKDEKEDEPAKGSDWVTMEAKPREAVALVQPRAAPKHYNAVEQVCFCPPSATAMQFSCFGLASTCFSTLYGAQVH